MFPTELKELIEIGLGVVGVGTPVYYMIKNSGKQEEWHKTVDECFKKVLSHQTTCEKARIDAEIELSHKVDRMDGYLRGLKNGVSE